MISWSDGGWVQLGWMEGTIGYFGVDSSCDMSHYQCARTLAEYELYVEKYEPGAGNYYLVALVSPLGYSGSVTYRVEYNPTTSCWNAYYNYSTPSTAPICVVEPTSGDPFVVNETRTDFSYIGMPESEFGSANANTNEAIRIKSAAGYAPWQPPLFTRHTATMNDRSGDPGYFYYSFYVRYYHFLTYGGVQ